MLSTSFKSIKAFRDPSIIWFPKVITWANYKTAFDLMDFWKTLWSTVRLELFSALIEIITCAVTAYGLARFNFKIKKILMGMLLLLIFLPTQMLIIPLMINFNDLDFLGILGLIGNISGTELRPSVLDTVWSFWLPSLFGVGLRSGMMIYIYYLFFKGLPKELEEAAWIDGSNPFRTFVQIAVPSSSVVILTVSVLSVVWHWNDYYLAVMYTSEHYPLAVAVAYLSDNATTIGIWNAFQRMSITYAGCIIFLLPLLVAYLFVQRWFVKSIDRVGITG